MFKALSRLLLSGIFISGGYSAFRQPGARVEKVAKAGLPSPHEAVQLNGLSMTIGGSLLALNIAPKLAATLLLFVLIPTTLVGHPFWQEEDAAARRPQQIQFLKNLAIIGGLLLFLRDRED